MRKNISLIKILLLYRFNLDQIFQSVSKTNRVYHGYFPANQTTVSVQNSLDPWHTLGITNNNTIGVEALYVN